MNDAALLYGCVVSVSDELDSVLCELFFVMSARCDVVILTCGKLLPFLIAGLLLSVCVVVLMQY